MRCSAGLTHLQAAEFLYETRLFPDPEYTFKHALTHDVTYGTLLQDRRKALHARNVGAIERSYPDRLAEHVERLAHHAVRGELWEQAVTTSVRLASRHWRDRPTGKRELLRAGADALGHLPETRARLEQAIDLLFDLRTSLFRSENSSGSSAVSAKPKAWPGARRSTAPRAAVAYMCHNLY